jgi:hypothetical protein
MTTVGVAGLAALVLLCTQLARPVVLMWVAVFAFAFVPVYWVPFAFHLFPHPGIVLMLVLALFSLPQAGRVARLNAIDLGVVAFTLLTAMAVVLHVRTSNDWTTILSQWVAPYVAARIALGGAISAKAFMSAWAVAGIVTVPFAIVEAITNSNPFQELTVNTGYASTWGTEQFRLGRARSEVAFGHSICYSMFVTTAAFFAIAMALGARRDRDRVLWLIGTAGLLAAQFVTQARTGWVMLLVGAGGAIILLLRRQVSFGIRARLSAMAGLLVAAVAAIAVLDAGTVDRLTSIFRPDPTSELASSSAAREGLFSAASAAWSPFGNASSAFIAAGIESVDNTYLLLIDRWGFLATAVLPIAALVLLWDVLFNRVTAWTVVSVASLANLVAWLFVAPITQQQNLVWLLLGAAAAGIARSRRTTA